MAKQIMVQEALHIMWNWIKQPFKLVAWLLGCLFIYVNIGIFKIIKALEYIIYKW